MAHRQDEANGTESMDDCAPLQRIASSSPAKLVLLFGLALAVFLRLYDLGVQDFWIDEIHTLANASAQRAAFQALPHETVLSGLRTFSDQTADTGVTDVWRGMEADSHPPIYFVIHHLWRRVTGDGEFVARLPGAAFSVLAIIPLFLLMRDRANSWVGAWLVLGLAVSFAHIRMAQECRPYSLGMLWVALSYWAFVRMQVGSGQLRANVRAMWALVYGVSVYLGVMTHYFTVIAMAGQVIYACLYFRGGLLRTWLIATGAAVAAFGLTWGPQLFAQYDFITSQEWLHSDAPGHAWRTVLRLLDLPYRVLCAHDPARLSVWRSALCLVGVVLLLAALRRFGRSEATVFVCWYLTAAGLFAMIDLFTGRETLKPIRYVSILAPALIGMIVPAVMAFRRRGCILLAVAFTVGVLFSLRLPTQDNPHSMTAAGLVAERMAPDTLLVFDGQDWPSFWASQVYHTVAHYLARYPQSAAVPFLLIRKEPEDALRNQIEGFQRLVIVSPRLEGVPNMAPSHFELADQTGWVNQIGRIFVFVRQPQ